MRTTISSRPNYYDTDTLNLPTWIEPPGSKANRLLGYEEIETVYGNLIGWIKGVRMIYEYFYVVGRVGGG